MKPMFENPPRLQSFGRTATAHLALAERLIKGGHDQQALAEVDAALADNPELALAHFSRGVLLVKFGDLAAAAESLRYAIRLDDTLVKAYLMLAHVHLELDESDDALEAVDTALALDTDDAREMRARTHLARGNVLSELKRDEDAIASYRKALERDPQLQMARYKLGCLLAAAGRHVEAIEQVLRAQRMNPLQPMTRLSLGDSLVAQGDFEAAEAEYREVIAMAPWMGEAHERMADLYLARGLDAEATKSLQLALKTEPKLFDCHVKLGRIYMKVGNFDQACEEFQAAVNLDPLLPEVTEMLAQAQAVRGYG